MSCQSRNHSSQSEIKCYCGRNPVQYVSRSEKNPGRRFMKCSNPVFGCRFWEWIDEPLAPLVQATIDAKLNNTQMKMKILVVLLVVCFFALFVNIFVKKDECYCNCNCAKYDLAI